MKVSNKLLEKLIVEELTQQMEEGFGDVLNKAKSAVGIGPGPANKNKEVITALAEVHRILQHLDVIDPNSVAGDRFGLISDDAHIKFANFAKQKGLPELIKLFVSSYGPLEHLRQAVISSKDKNAADRFMNEKEGIIGRLFPVSVFLRTDGEEISQKFRDLRQLEDAEHKGAIQIPQNAGLLSLIAAQSKLKESLNRMNKLAGVKNK